MRLGTNFREERIVRGDCEDCGEHDVLLYAASAEGLPDVLMCTDCSRKRAKANPIKQECATCGATGNVWRDPLKRDDSRFFCERHHDPSMFFQNRWADTARNAPVHPRGHRPKCALANLHTDCKGEVKWRSAMGMEVCNKHAGKVSANPANN